MKLDARLLAIYNMVPQQSVVADIGCDHAYLACALLKTGRARRVFACEANLGPLENARKTIAENRLSHRIETVLTNGLTDLPHGLIDTFVIAGMGGELIGEILLAPAWTRDTRFRFILNPMTKEEELRRTLFENGFAIGQETCVFIDNKVYIVMCVSYTEYTDIDLKFDDIRFYTGCHLSGRDFASAAYLDKVLLRLEKKIAGLNRSGGPENAEEARRLEKIADEIERERRQDPHAL